jgi:hypothetical protein
MRILFLLVFIPVYFRMGWFAFPADAVLWHTTFGLAGTFSLFIVIFAYIRTISSDDQNPIKIIIFSLMCMPAFAVFAYVMQQLWIYTGLYLSFFPALIYAFSLWRGVGFRIRHMYQHKKIGNSVCNWCDVEDEGAYMYCCDEHRDTAQEDITVKCRNCGAEYTNTRQAQKDGTNPLCPECVRLEQYKAEVRRLERIASDLRRSRRHY